MRSVLILRMSKNVGILIGIFAVIGVVMICTVTPYAVLRAGQDVLGYDNNNTNTPMTVDFDYKRAIVADATNLGGDLWYVCTTAIDFEIFDNMVVTPNIGIARATGAGIYVIQKPVETRQIYLVKNSQSYILTL